MASMATKVIAGAALILAIFATAEARQLLQATTPQQQVLTQVLCFADQAAASARQLAGLTGGTTGLPPFLTNLVGTSSSIQSTLQAQLGITPAAACTTVPPAPTLNVAVTNVFCSTTNVVRQLQTAVGLGLPAAQQTAIQNDIAQLSNSFNTIEAGLVAFLFNIRC